MKLLIKKNKLTDGPIFSTLVAFSIPTLLSNIMQSLNGSINTIWVGRFLGENALAATANANIITFLLFSLVFGFGMAATVIVGQNVGRHEIVEARKAFGASIGLCWFLSVIVSVGGAYLAEEVLTALATPPEAYQQALAYLRVIFFGMPPSLTMVMMMMGLRGAGDSLTPLWFMILSVLLDTILNPLFILGIGPFPQMGIAGSAFATVCAAYISLIALIWCLYWRNLPLRLRGAELLFLLPRFPLIRKIVTNGLPMSMQMTVMATASLVMISLVNAEGVNVTAAYNVSQQLWTYLQMPAMAVGAAVSAMVAQNIGAGLWNRVDKTTFCGLLIAESLTIALLVLLFVFDRAVMALFLGSESTAISEGRHIQLLASWSFLFFGAAMIINGSLRANGVVVMPLLFLFIAVYPVRLGFYYLTYRQIGEDAIWFSFPVGSLVALILSLLYYHFSDWRKNEI